MPTYSCPNGHDSTDPEYCSECGKKIAAAPGTGGAAAMASTGAAVAGGEACPDCGMARANTTAVFCEVCRYNFATKTPWSPDQSAAAVTPAPPLSNPPDAGSAATTVPASVSPEPPLRWEAVVVVDPSLYVDPDPTMPCPVGEPDRTFPLDFAENLIGRRSERRAIFPEIDLSGDHGISSRHAILYREANGTLSLLDVGSTNGTQINGKDVVVGVRTPLQDGDQITLGCWTRMTVRATKPGGGNTP